jgi:aminodeoxyfutalosine deaminase
VCAALRQSIACGVTTVGDVASRPREVREIILGQRGRPRVTSYGEVRAMAGRRWQVEEHLDAATDLEMSPWIRVGVSPHAPYSVEPDAFRRCLAAARAAMLPLTSHFAETPYESEFLAAQRGPLRELWDAIGGWDDAVPRFEGGPIRYAKHLGLLDYKSASLVHVNYCDDAELALLATGKASVVYCPRTHAYFGHPPHRWRKMLAAGINVAVGTDSTASAPDLNLVDDLRLLHEIAPEVPAQTLWEMATRRAARAVGEEKTAGTISPQKVADFVAFDVESEDPLQEVLESRPYPVRAWIMGRPAAEAVSPR